MDSIESAIQLCKTGGTLPKCRADRTTKISIDMIVVVAILYFALTCYILMYKLRKYKKQPYEEIQVAVVFYRLQVTCLASPCQCALQFRSSFIVTMCAVIPWSA